jgi:hypothetical protein
VAIERDQVAADTAVGERRVAHRSVAADATHLGDVRHYLLFQRFVCIGHETREQVVGSSDA